MPLKRLAQHFLTEGASVVSIGNEHSCRGFRAIDIRTSQYISSDGRHIAFADVERNPAAGLWVIGAANEMPTSPQLSIDALRESRVWRIVLKYPVESLEMESDGTRRDLSDRLDAAGDSVTLSAEDRAELQSAWRDAKSVKLIGRSLDTEREIIDTLLPVLDSDLLACDAFERGSGPDIVTAIKDAHLRAGEMMPSMLPWRLDASPLEVQNLGLSDWTTTFDPSRHRLGNNGPIRVRWKERLPGPPKEARLVGCSMTDLGGEIERYSLVEVTGFVAQSEEAWITRDDAGDVRQVYISGVFEALRKTGSEEWTADVSVAAFANNPFEEPIYKGCLGSQAIPMAGRTGTVFEAPTNEPIVAAFTSSSQFDPMALGLNTFNSAAGGAGHYGGLQFDGGAMSALALDDTKNPIETVDNNSEELVQPSLVPLPGATWLYLTCFALLGLVARRRLADAYEYICK